MKSLFQDPRYVSKPWGHELWIADGVRTPYALKRILFKSGFRSSLQVHQFKVETNFILEGTGVFQICEDIFDCESFLSKRLTQDMINHFLEKMIEVEIKSGDVIDVKPGQIHRVIARTDLVFIEASTTELDDVIRIADDTDRGNGKIAFEHSD
jgi:mannose-6-phosphate isomerase-like protein (cupin superfamily)